MLGKCFMPANMFLFAKWKKKTSNKYVTLVLQLKKYISFYVYIRNCKIQFTKLDVIGSS